MTARLTLCLALLTALLSACAHRAPRYDHQAEIPKTWQADLPSGVTPLAPAPDAATALQQLGSPSDLSLLNAVRLALANSERLGIAGESYLQTVLQQDTIRGATLPRLALMGNAELRDESSTGGDFNGGSGGSNRSDNTNSSLYLSARQSIWSGFRDRSAMAAAKARAQAQAASLRGSRNLIALETTGAYYDALIAQRQQEIIAVSLALRQERLKEVQARFDAADARRGELLLSRSELARVQAELTRAEDRAAQAREVLWRLMGVAVELPLSAPAVPEPALRPLDELVILARQQRPDLVAIRQRHLAATHDLEKIKREGYPELSAAGELYGRHDLSPDEHWAVRLEAEWTLYEGGARMARLRTAESVIRQTSLELQELERAVLHDLRLTLEELRGNDLLQRDLRQQLALAQESLAQTQTEAQAGAASNLEVVSAQNAVLEAELAVGSETLQRQFLRLKLLTLTGELPVAGQ